LIKHSNGSSYLPRSEQNSDACDTPKHPCWGKVLLVFRWNCVGFIPSSVHFSSFGATFPSAESRTSVKPEELQAIAVPIRQGAVFRVVRRGDSWVPVRRYFLPGCVPGRAMVLSRPPARASLLGRWMRRRYPDTVLFNL